MIRTVARVAAKPHSCGSCDRYIETGTRYLEHVASPNHDYLGNIGWWHTAECFSCAVRYGRGPLLDAIDLRTRPGRCDECGRFVKSSDLHPVWGPIPSSGPDHEACAKCKPLAVAA